MNMLRDIIVVVCLLSLPQCSLGGTPFLVNPASLVVERGSPAMFSCSYYRPGLQWRDNLASGEVVIFDGQQKNATDSKYDNFQANLTESTPGYYDYVLTISNTEVADEGEYVCMFTGTNSERASGMLRVEVKPTLILDTHGSMIEGVPHNVACEAIGSRPRVTITWYLDDMRLRAGIRNTNPYSGDPTLSNTRSVFTFTPSASMNGKVLSCRTSGHTLTLMGRSVLDQDRTTTINIANCSSATPEESTFVKQYVFAIKHDIPAILNKKVKITLNTNDKTCISIPCLWGDEVRCYCSQADVGEIYVDNCTTIAVFSSRDITVHGLVQNTRRLTGSFLVFPSEFLGNEYVIDCYRSFRANATLAISAVFNDTTISSSCPTPCPSTLLQRQTLDGRILQAGSSLFVSAPDVTGVRVVADKPIAITVQSHGVYIPYVSQPDTVDSGFVIEQLLPVSKLGRIHLIPPFQSSAGGSVFRVLAVQDDTHVSVTNCDFDGPQQQLLLNTSQYQDFVVTSETNNFCSVVASNPVQVTQYISSSHRDEYGDPSMVLVPPVRAYHGNVTLNVGDHVGYFEQHMDITVEEKYTAGMLFNDRPIDAANWRCIFVEDVYGDDQDNGYCFQHPGQYVPPGFHHVGHADSEARFLVRRYGFDTAMGMAELVQVANVPADPTQAPTSTPAPCPNLANPENGAVITTGNSAVYSCAAGFHFSNGDQQQVTRMCQDGTWNGTEPVCVQTPTTASPAMMSTSAAPMVGGPFPADSAQGSNGGPTRPGAGMAGNKAPGMADAGDKNGNKGGLNDSQIALAVLATILIVLAIAFYSGLLYWKYRGSSYVAVSTSY